MMSHKICCTLSRLNNCANIQPVALLQKYTNSNPMRNPSSCFRLFRTKKSLEIENPDSTGKYSEFFSEPFSIGRLKKPLVFTICTGTGCYIGCSIWSYENYINRGTAFINSMKRDIQNNNKNYRPDEPKWRKELRKFWNSLHPGDHLLAPILFLNGLVFAAWTIPRLHRVMYKYFASNPQSKTLCSPMLLSTFSHQSLPHILANMFVLHSFISNSVQDLGKEQFLGFYVTAGVTASMLSYVHRILTRTRGFSLGASGAIMGVLAHTCVTHPTTELGILFVPYVRFSAENAIQGIILFDTLGVLFRWKIFDHAAHLGGALFGILYAKYGDSLWRQRSGIVQYWKSLKDLVK